MTLPKELHSAGVKYLYINQILKEIDNLFNDDYSIKENALAENLKAIYKNIAIYSEEAEGLQQFIQAMESVISIKPNDDETLYIEIKTIFKNGKKTLYEANDIENNPKSINKMVCDLKSKYQIAKIMTRHCTNDFYQLVFIKNKIIDLNSFINTLNKDKALNNDTTNKIDRLIADIMQFLPKQLQLPLFDLNGDNLECIANIKNEIDLEIKKEINNVKNKSKLLSIKQKRICELYLKLFSFFQEKIENADKEWRGFCDNCDLYGASVIKQGKKNLQNSELLEKFKNEFNFLFCKKFIQETQDEDLDQRLYKTQKFLQNNDNSNKIFSTYKKFIDCKRGDEYFSFAQKFAILFEKFELDESFSFSNKTNNLHNILLIREKLYIFVDSMNKMNGKSFKKLIEHVEREAVDNKVNLELDALEISLERLYNDCNFIRLDSEGELLYRYNKHLDFLSRRDNLVCNSTPESQEILNLEEPVKYVKEQWAKYFNDKNLQYIGSNNTIDDNLSEQERDNYYFIIQCKILKQIINCENQQYKEFRLYFTTLSKNLFIKFFDSVILCVAFKKNLTQKNRHNIFELFYLILKSKKINDEDKIFLFDSIPNYLIHFLNSKSEFKNKNIESFGVSIFIDLNLAIIKCNIFQYICNDSKSFDQMDENRRILIDLVMNCKEKVKLNEIEGRINDYPIESLIKIFEAPSNDIIISDETECFIVTSI